MFGSCPKAPSSPLEKARTTKVLAFGSITYRTAAPSKANARIPVTVPAATARILRLLSSDHIEDKFQLILQFQCRSGDGRDLDGVVRLQKREFSVRSERIHSESNLAHKRLAVGNSV